MNILLYIFLFIIGTIFGSFYTLATYRIPKKQDITHTHSYCPNCDHKLGFLDLIPVFSYISLKGKCRYCKEKISPRYIIIEILSGLLFALMGYVMKLTFNNLTLVKLVQYGFIALYITFIFLISGIDKERRSINKSVIIYGMVISIMYIIYLCIVDQTSIYRYVIYAIIYIVILIVDASTSKEKNKISYITRNFINDCNRSNIYRRIYYN